MVLGDCGLTRCSFFGEQEGDFELVLNSIAATKNLDDDDGEDSDEDEDLKKSPALPPRDEAPRSWWRTLLCGLF